jgi:hypothetical protein
MTQHAHYISETEVTFPRSEEFRGVPNWQLNDSALRKRGYVPMTDVPAPQEGKRTVLDGFEYVQQTKTRVEPRPYVVEDWEEREDPETHEKTREKTGEHTEWRDTEITLDDSYIRVTQSHYEDIPAPEPPPLKRQFSKGDLLEALMALNLYDAAKAIYAADLDLQIAWAGFANIDMDYPATQSIMEQYPELFSQANVEALQRYITFGKDTGNE